MDLIGDQLSKHPTPTPILYYMRNMATMEKKEHARSSSTNNELPATKKTRVGEENKANSLTEQELRLCNELWERFGNYMESLHATRADDEHDDDDDEKNNPNKPDDGHGGGGGGGKGGGAISGDTDELEEIRSLIRQHYSSETKQQQQQLSNNSISSIQSCMDMIPILNSVVCHILADEAFGQELLLRSSSSTTANLEFHTLQHEYLQHIYELLDESLTSFPLNAATWSMAANFGRSLAHQPFPPALVTQWYNHAVHCAQTVRQQSLELLERLEQEQEEKLDKHHETEEEEEAGNDDEAIFNDTIKEWIEMLLLNHVVGVEWVIDIDDEEQKNEDDEENNSIDPAEKDGDDDDDHDDDDKKDDSGYWSSSSVEATARFMAAMQLSTIGQHDEALLHLRHFPLTHRLSPTLWDARPNVVAPPNKVDSDNKNYENPVVVFGRRSQEEEVGANLDDGGLGVLPRELYERLCQLFGPEASFWTESNYDMRGYYSFFMDRTTTTKQDDASSSSRHTNLISEVIEDHLLPLVLQQQQQRQEKQQENNGKSNQQEIVGYEWWVHHRPMEQNLGHNLHFDTDEALLKDVGEITHPLYSSVLYLTGQGDGGATIVLDQTPDSTTVAPRAWKNSVANNTFLVFPGNLLHGVLPCQSSSNSSTNREQEPHLNNLHTKPKVVDGPSTDNDDDKRQNKPPDLNDLLHRIQESEKADKKHDENKNKASHRLTFMVGFWTRCVPDQMKERRLYGPCGPIPPATKEHQWVQEMNKGYSTDVSLKKDNQNKNARALCSTTTFIAVEPVPTVSPVWEEITPLRDNNDSNKKLMLEIPRAIDHRFFVNGAPECFRASLFEDHDSEDDEEEADDDDDDDDEEEEGANRN